MDLKTWHYWDRASWRLITEHERAIVDPNITSITLQGDGAIDPRMSIAVGDEASVTAVKAMHRRFKRGQA